MNEEVGCKYLGLFLTSWDSSEDICASTSSESIESRLMDDWKDVLVVHHVVTYDHLTEEVHTVDGP
jgi:hypothetical protein